MTLLEMPRTAGRYLLVGALLAAQVCFAQESRGTIIGRVMDPSGAVVPGVTVQATNLATNTGGSSETNESGHYEIPYLLPGLYRVTVTATGFKSAIRDQIELRVADRLALDFTLELGDVGESVTVTGETPLLETTSASVGSIMNQQLLVDLPGVGGNPFYYTRLVSGVINTGNWGGGGSQAVNESTQITVNGTTNASEASVDGSPNMAQRNVVFTPPRDLVQEMKVHTAGYDASLGHAAGAMTNISTKSGTNELHGTAYHLEAQWYATPWFTNYYIYNPLTGPITDEKKARTYTAKQRRISGATATGPVMIPKLYNGQDRTFWTFGYERTNNWNEPGRTYTVPSAAEKRGDLSELLLAGASYQIYDPFTTVPAAKAGRFQRQPIPGNIIPADRLDPIAQNMLSYYPDPNQPGTIDGRQNYFLVCRNWEFFNRNLLSRFDHVLSEKHRVFARWNNAQFDQQSKTLDTAATQNRVDRTGWGAALDDVYLFSPQLLLNVRYAFNYQNPWNYRGSQGFDLTSLGFPRNLVDEISSKSNPGGFTFPLTQIDGSAYTNLGHNGGDDTKTYYHNAGATMTKITGGHSTRFGAEFRLMQENGYSYGNVSPQLVFAQTYTRGPLDNSPTAPIGQGLASMLLGVPSGGSASINASRAEQSTFWGFFVQDDWRVTRRLTVNAGLRYEYEGPTTERFNRSIRAFDFTTESPIAAQARANYAKSPIPELPLTDFRPMGGLTFAGVNRLPRGLWNADKNNFAPRIGLAYQLNSKTVLRAGYGVFFDVLGVDRQDVNQGGFNQATSIIASINNGQTYQATLANPFPFGLQLPPGASGGLSTFLGRGASFFNEDPLNPYMQRWSFSIQRELPGRILLETSYVGNRGTKLAANRNFNATPAKYLSTLPSRDQPAIDFLSAQVANPFFGIAEFAGTALGNQKVSRANLLRPYPHFSDITANLPGGYSYFHSLQTQVEKRMSAGLTFQASWNYSKFMDATSYLNPTDPRPEKVISPNDRTHRLVVSAIYELPFGRGRSFLGNARGITSVALGGWQVQGFFEGQTGAPLGFGNAIFNGNLHDIELPLEQRRVERWFNTDAGFNRNPQQQLASNVRALPSRFNGVRADGINNFQLSAFKYFDITERFRLRFMVMAVNAFNHPQFAAPDTTPTSTLFGKISNTASEREVFWGLKLVF